MGAAVVERALRIEVVTRDMFGAPSSLLNALPGLRPSVLSTGHKDA